MNQRGAMCFILFFLLLSLLPSAAMLVLGSSEAAANEVLSPKPMLHTADGKWNPNCISEASDYFADHFAFRQELITADSALKSSVFHTSAQSKVALGQDGWLFYEQTIDHYTGAEKLTDRQLYCIAHALRMAQDAAEAQGRTLIFTIAPDKLSLYPQYGPSGLTRVGETSADALGKALDAQGVRYLDLFEALGESDEVLYHKLDSHWTNRGAALAADALLDALGLPAQNLYDQPGHAARTHSGDLYVMLYPAGKELDWQWTFDTEPSFTYEKPLRAADDIRIETSSSAEAGPLLMFRDSFGNAWHSILAAQFSHAVFSRAYPYDLTLADEIGADTVVVEIVERNLAKLAENHFVMWAPQYEPERLADASAASGAAVTASLTPAPKLEGAVCLSGGIDDVCDADSSIFLYLPASDALYELSPTGASGPIAFTGYLPDSADLRGAQLLYRADGQWRAALPDLSAAMPESNG